MKNSKHINAEELEIQANVEAAKTLLTSNGGTPFTLLAVYPTCDVINTDTELKDTPFRAIVGVNAYGKCLMEVCDGLKRKDGQPMEDFKNCALKILDQITSNHRPGGIERYETPNKIIVTPEEHHDEPDDLRTTDDINDFGRGLRISDVRDYTLGTQITLTTR